MKHLVAGCPAIASGQRLAQDFADMLHARTKDRLGPWLEEAAACPVAEFRDFAAGLRRDLEAVEAALTYDWSNGQTEGQITKVKMLKRQMYGRASVPLLRSPAPASCGVSQHQGSWGAASRACGPGECRAVPSTGASNFRGRAR